MLIFYLSLQLNFYLIDSGSITPVPTPAKLKPVTIQHNAAPINLSKYQIHLRCCLETKR